MGKRAKLQWCERDYGDRGALNEKQKSELSNRFEISKALLDQFSVDLGHALHPRTQVRLLQDARDNWKRRQATVDKLLTNLKSQLSKVQSGVKAAEQVDFDDSPEGRACRDLNLVSELWWMEANLFRFQHRVSAYQAHTWNAGHIWRDKKDRTRVWDRRRTLVCNQIFAFWRSLDRELTYTTFAERNERGGPLFDFANEVVSFVTDPPATINGDTLKKDLEKYKGALARWESANT